MWSNMVQNGSNLSLECFSNVAETCAVNGNQRPQTDRDDKKPKIPATFFHNFKTMVLVEF